MNHDWKVIFRADGNSEIGLGHIARATALADMLKNNFSCVFYTRKPDPAILAEIKKYCNEVVETDPNISYQREASLLAQQLGSTDLVILDGYNFDTEYQRTIKSSGCKLVCIDDIHRFHFMADVVINHAPGISIDKYSVEPYTRLYLGTDYLILKRIFLDEARHIGIKPDLGSSPVLLCLGGADIHNATLEVAKWINQFFPTRELFIVIGSANPHRKVLEDYCKTRQYVSLYYNLESTELISLMKRAQIAVLSSSTVALEYMCVKGLLFILRTADNQQDLYNGLLERHCALPFEMFKSDNNCVDVRKNQSLLVDGKSNERLVQIIKDLAGQ